MIQGIHFSPSFFFFFPCPSNPSSLSGFIKSFQISKEDFFPNDAKNFNVALDNGKPLFNYHWKLPPLSKNLVFGSFKAFHVGELLLPSKLPLCFQ